MNENKRQVLAKEEGTKLETHFQATKGGTSDAISCAVKYACRNSMGLKGVRERKGTKNRKVPSIF